MKKRGVVKVNNDEKKREIKRGVWCGGMDWDCVTVWGGECL